MTQTATRLDCRRPDPHNPAPSSRSSRQHDMSYGRSRGPSGACFSSGSSVNLAGSPYDHVKLYTTIRTIRSARVTGVSTLRSMSSVRRVSGVLAHYHRRLPPVGRHLHRTEAGFVAFVLLHHRIRRRKITLNDVGAILGCAITTPGVRLSRSPAPWAWLLSTAVHEIALAFVTRCPRARPCSCSHRV